MIVSNQTDWNCRIISRILNFEWFLFVIRYSSAGRFGTSYSVLIDQLKSRKRIFPIINRHPPLFSPRNINFFLEIFSFSSAANHVIGRVNSAECSVLFEISKFQLKPLDCLGWRGSSGLVFRPNFNLPAPVDFGPEILNFRILNFIFFKKFHFKSIYRIELYFELTSKLTGFRKPETSQSLSKKPQPNTKTAEQVRNSKHRRNHHYNL